MGQMKKLIVCYLVAGLLAFPVHSEQKLQLQWGPEEGNFEVPTGTTYCGYKGMRLPTRDELLAACQAGVTKSWDKAGKPYLTSTVTGANRAFAVHSATCAISEVDGLYDSLSIRCVRSVPG